MPVVGDSKLIAGLKALWEARRGFTANFWVIQRRHPWPTQHQITFEDAEAVWHPPLSWPDSVMNVPSLVQWTMFVQQFRAWAKHELPSYQAGGNDCENFAAWCKVFAWQLFPGAALADAAVRYTVQGQVQRDAVLVALAEVPPEPGNPQGVVLVIIAPTPREAFTEPPPESPFRPGDFEAWKLEE